MPLHRRFRSVIRIGPVQVGTAHDGRGREKHTAACTAATRRPHPPLPRPLKGPLP
jgi:mobile element transfer protein